MCCCYSENLPSEFLTATYQLLKCHKIIFPQYYISILKTSTKTPETMEMLYIFNQNKFQESKVCSQVVIDVWRCMRRQGDESWPLVLGSLETHVNTRYKQHTMRYLCYGCEGSEAAVTTKKNKQNKTYMRSVGIISFKWTLLSWSVSVLQQQNFKWLHANPCRTHMYWNI